MKQTKISIIIPVKPGGETQIAIEALKKVDYQHELIEVLLSFGFSPSRQRNEAAKKAKGEIFYFLDNDSEIESQVLKRAAAVFAGNMRIVKTPQARGFSLLPYWLSSLIVKKFFSGIIYQSEIGVVGGPNVWWKQEPFWAVMAGMALESFFLHGKMAARYRPIGLIHRANEKELILCNLAIRKEIFNKIGGFEEILYPNEENELLNRIEKAGYQLIYHPGILVFRRHRQSFREIFKAFFHYGRGRMEQMRIEKTLMENLLFLAPLAFLIYLGGLLFYHSWFSFLPAALYFGLSFGSALGFAQRRKKLYLAFFLPFLFLAIHLVYAFGLLYGLMTDFKKKKLAAKKKKIKVIKIKKFGRKWPNLLDIKQLMV